MQDILPNALTESADVVLPAAAWAEKDGCWENFAGQDSAVLAAVAPPGGHPRAKGMSITNCSAAPGCTTPRRSRRRWASRLRRSTLPAESACAGRRRSLWRCNDPIARTCKHAIQIIMDLFVNLGPASGSSSRCIVHLVVLGAVAYLILLERKVASWVQDRIGPNRVGLGFGIIPVLKDMHMCGFGQPLADGLKFIFKEDYRAKGVDKVLFTLAPVMMIIVIIISIAVIPWGGMQQTIAPSM